MIEYNIVKFCRMCKKRFIVKKGESKNHYCADCYKVVEKQRKEQQEE